MEEEIPQQPENGIPPPRPTDPHSPQPARDTSPPTLYPQPTPPLTLLHSWPDEPTPSLVTQGQHLPFPQENNIVTMLHWLNKAGEGLANKVLLEWALDMLCSLEDWRWLWSLEPATTPSLSPTLLNHLPLLLSYDACNANPWTTYVPIALNTSAPSATEQPQDTPNVLTPCAPVPSVESSGMWAPVAQPQPQPALLLSLPEWVTLEDLSRSLKAMRGVMLW